MNVGRTALIAGAVLAPVAGLAAWELTRHHGDDHAPGADPTPSPSPGAAPTGPTYSPTPSATPGPSPAATPSGPTPAPSPGSSTPTTGSTAPTPGPATPSPGPTTTTPSPSPTPTHPAPPTHTAPPATTAPPSHPTQPTAPPTHPTAPAVPTAPRTTGTTYTVVVGDTVSAIARRYGSTVAAIAAANHLADPGNIHPGQRLVIPAPGAPTTAPPTGGGTTSPTGPTHPTAGSQGAVPPGAAIFSVHTGSKLVALTFDDGPGGAYTDAVLATLARHHVHATFFVVGENVARDPARVRAEAAAGNAIGVHTWDHTDLTTLGDAAVRSQLTRTADQVESATGHRPDIFRAPYGARNARVDADARAVGMRDVLWNVDTVDWSRPGTAAIEREAVGSTHPGSIVLMHDGGGDRSQTVAALDSTITQLQAKGYEFVTVPQLVAAQQGGG